MTAKLDVASLLLAADTGLAGVKAAWAFSFAS